MIDVEPTIQEELERLAPREDVRADWSEVVRRLERPARAPRRRRRLGAAVVVCAALLALAVVAPWSGSPTVVDRALAAVGDEPVLHVVIEHPSHIAPLVRISDGVPVPRISRSEIWFDGSRDLKKTVSTLDGAVVDELLESRAGGFTRGGRVYTCAWIAAHPVEATKAGVSCNASGDNGTTPRDVPEEPPTLEDALAGFLDGYASALASGRAREVGRGIVERREVVWLTLPAADRHAQRVAIDASTYEPVLVETADGQVSFRVRTIETIRFEQAYFSMPPRHVTSPGGIGGTVHGAHDVVTEITPAQAASALGGAAYWLGESWGDYRLVAARRVELSIRLAPKTDERRRATGVEFEYARVGDDGSIERGSTFTLRETTTCVVRWGWMCTPHDPRAPGTMTLEVSPRLRIDGIYVAIWGGAIGHQAPAPLEIARALELLTP